jgi:hypothetical protein
MKSFKDYIKNPVDNPFLDWKSSFGEIRKKSIKEETQQVLKHTGQISNVSVTGVYDKIHDHEDVKSSVPLNSDQINSIKTYCSNWSSDINSYLRHRMGHFASRMTIGSKYFENQVKNHINNISSAFKPEHTNKKSIETYSGIPIHVGERLKRLTPGEQTNLPGFTSTSTDINVGKDFADQHFSGRRISNKRHVIKFHVHPGAGLSVAPHSHHGGESEILLNRGTKTKYLGNTEEYDARNNHIYVIHHMEAHPSEIMSLDQYPHEYEHNR